MATVEKFRLTLEERIRRRFSEEFKKKKVNEMELGHTTAAEVSREYQVRYSNVIKWKKIYGSKPKDSVRLIVEM
ncbi:MAG: transposase, partial [Bacteroidetes bacterium]|nr:transposase [Bacteroidota bacterium]